MFTDEDIGDLSFEARWLFAGLFTQADREGRLEDRPRKLKVEVMPYDSVNIEHLLRELTEARFITRYEVEDKRYIHIRTFWKHQHFHIKEPPSTLPAPPAPVEHGASTVRAPVSPARKGREGIGREGKEECASTGLASGKDPPPPPDLFSEEFFDNLQDQGKFQHLDVREVFQKWKNYCEASGKPLDPKYFLNWLNREKGNGPDDDRGTSAQARRVAAQIERDN